MYSRHGTNTGVLKARCNHGCTEGTARVDCRYNRLLSTIHQSLHDLVKAVKGLVVMSQDLEKMANSLYMNTVPLKWAGKVWQPCWVRNRQV